MDKNMIPPGSSCIIHDKKEIRCPYYTRRRIKDVGVPWCKYLNKGGVDSNWTQEERLILSDHFGSAKKMFDELPLENIGDKFDTLKECGIGYLSSEETIKEWCRKAIEFDREQKIKRVLDAVPKKRTLDSVPKKKK